MSHSNGLAFFAARSLALGAVWFGALGLGACANTPGDEGAVTLDAALPGIHGADGAVGSGGGGPNGAGGASTDGAGGDCRPFEELCDAVDNDCDGLVDEVGCACTADPGCFAGPPERRGVGACRDGTRTCDAVGELAQACVGSIGPSAEICDGQDNDCDGATDEGCCGGAPCVPDAGPEPMPPDGGPPPPPPPPTAPPDDGPCETGAATGLICAPDGSPIAGARVSADTTDCDGQPRRVETQSAAGGSFTLEGLAPGPVRIVVEAGRFRQVFEVDIVAGGIANTNEGGATACLPEDAAAVAVTTGNYDRIQDIITRLGFEHDVYCGDGDDTYGARALLGDWARLSQYDVVFVNCGLGVGFDGADGRQMVANVQRFVAEGGSLYVSDLAAHLIAAAFPGRITFRADMEPVPEFDPCCTCIQCPAACGARADAPRADGECMGTVEAGWECANEGPLYGFGAPGRRDAQVHNAALQQALGRDALAVDFDADGWVEIGGLANDVEVLVASDGEPLMVRFQEQGGGRVVFTTFHNEAQLGPDVAAILRALVFQL